jgi:hypothetical protein
MLLPLAYLPRTFERSMTADYKCYYEAGEHFLHGKSLYFGSESSISCQFPYPTNSQGNPEFFSGFFYGPGIAMLFSLFSLLPYKFSLGLFTLLNWWIVILCLYFGREILGLPKSPTTQSIILPATLALILAFKPIQSNIDYAQISLLMLSFLLGFWICFRRGHDWTAALLLFLAVSSKIIPIFLFFYLLVSRKFKSIMTFSAKLIAILGITIMISIVCRKPLEDYWEFITALRIKTQAVELGNLAQSINSVLHRYLTDALVENEIFPKINIASFTPKVVSYIYILIAAASIAGLIWISRSFIRVLPQLGFLIFLLFLSTMPLLAPLAWEHYFSVNLISYFFILLFWDSKNNKLRILTRAYFVISLMLILSTSRDVLGPKWSYFMGSLSIQSLQSLLTILMICYLLHKAARDQDIRSEISSLYTQTRHV